MCAVRYDFARRRRHAVHLVSPSAAAASVLIPEPERTALIVGLRFAAHLRRLFPAFYDEHVVRYRRCTSHGNLLGIMTAFLSLAHSELLNLDLSANAMTPAGFGGYYPARLRFAPKNPAQALIQYHADSTALYVLAQDGKAWLHQPVPKVYGLSVDEVTTRRYNIWHERYIDKHMLSLAIWRMLGGTAWEILPAERVSEIASQHCIDEVGGQAIAVLPIIPQGTPLSQLCAELDRRAYPGLKQLGTIIAYCCGRTGNGYADVTLAEARQQYDQVIDLDWERPATAYIDQRAYQQQAAGYARAYSHLAGKATRDRDLLSRVRSAILDAVAAVADAGYDDTVGTYNPAALYWRTR